MYHWWWRWHNTSTLITHQQLSVHTTSTYIQINTVHRVTSAVERYIKSRAVVELHIWFVQTFAIVFVWICNFLWRCVCVCVCALPALSNRCIGRNSYFPHFSAAKFFVFLFFIVLLHTLSMFSSTSTCFYCSSFSTNETLLLQHTNQRRRFIHSISKLKSLKVAFIIIIFLFFNPVVICHKLQENWKKSGYAP